MTGLCMFRLINTGENTLTRDVRLSVKGSGVLMASGIRLAGNLICQTLIGEKHYRKGQKNEAAETYLHLYAILILVPVPIQNRDNPAGGKRQMY